MLIRCRAILDLNINIMGNFTSDTARKKDVKFLKCVELKLFLYIVGTPDSVKIALTDVSLLIIGSVRCAEQELILSCLFLISCHLTVL